MTERTEGETPTGSFTAQLHSFIPLDHMTIGMRARTALSLAQERQEREHAVAHQTSSSSIVVAAGNNNRDRELMPPPLPKYRSERCKKRKKIVLDEDEYTNALERIIERDFFPDSASLRRNDEGDDDSYTDALTESIRKNEMSLDKFSRQYTSEDNQSFEEIHERDLKAKREKFHWMYEPEEKGEKAGMLMLYYMDGRKLSVEERKKFEENMLLQNRDNTIIDEGSNDQRQNGPDTWKFRVRNQLMFPPELEVSEKISRVTEEADECRTKPAIKGWTGDPLLGYDASNNLTAKNPVILDKEIRESCGNNSYVGKSVIPEKAIVYSNTRIFNDVNEEIQNMRRISTPLERPHTPSTYSDAGSTFTEGTFDSSGNYRTVQMTPLIQPGSEVGTEPIFTWGDISGTPLILDPSSASAAVSSYGENISNSSSRTKHIKKDIDSDAPGFVMQPISQRESLGRDMSASARGKSERSIFRGGSNREKQKHKKISHHVRDKSDGTKLTPAALKLAQRLSAGSSTPLRSSQIQPSPQLSSKNGTPLSGGISLGKHPNESPFGGSLSFSYAKPKR